MAATQCVETTPDYLCVTDTCERYKCHYVWTCDLPDDPLEIEKCCVRFSFGEPQDLRLLRIKWLDFKNPPTLKVHVDGEYHSDITIVYGTATYHLHADKVSEVTFCGDDNETTGAVSDSMSEVRGGGPGTRCTLGRRTIDPQSLHKLTSGELLPRLRLTLHICRVWPSYVLKQLS